MPKYSAEEWEERKEKLLSYIRKNPEASIAEIKRLELNALYKFFKNRISKAKEAAGVPAIKALHREYKRKLSKEEEDHLILLYNCGFPKNALAIEYVVSLGCVLDAIKRAREERKKIIKDPQKKFIYAVRTYYSYRESYAGLKEEDKRAMRKIRECIILPLIDDVTSFTLDDLKGQSDPYESLLNAIFGKQTRADDETLRLGHDLETMLRDNSSVFYDEKSRMNAINRIKEGIVKKIRQGEYCFIPLSEEERQEFKQILGTLKPREEKVIYLRYGLEDGQPKTLKEIGRIWDLSGERIRQIEVKALRKLRHVSRAKELRKYLMQERLELLAHPRIVTQLKAKLEEKYRQIGELELKLDQALKRTEKTSSTAPRTQEESYLSRDVDELELSVRSSNCMKNAGIRYVGELVQKREAELMKTKNFGRKSLSEVKEILGAMGLSLGMENVEKYYIVDGAVADASLQEILNSDIDMLTLNPKLLDKIKNSRWEWYHHKVKIEDLVLETETRLLNSLREDAVEEIKKALSRYSLRLGMKIYRFRFAVH